MAMPASAAGLTLSRRELPVNAATSPARSYGAVPSTFSGGMMAITSAVFPAGSPVTCCCSSQPPSPDPAIASKNHLPACSRNRLMHIAWRSHGRNFQMIDFKRLLFLSVDVLTGSFVRGHRVGMWYGHPARQAEGICSAMLGVRHPAPQLVAGRRHLPKRCFGSGCARPVATPHLTPALIPQPTVVPCMSAVRPAGVGTLRQQTLVCRDIGGTRRRGLQALATITGGWLSTEFQIFSSGAASVLS